MKKILLFVLCTLLAIAALGGCADRQTDGGSDAPSTSASALPDNAGSYADADVEIDISAYRAPADVVEIDTDKEDPSNDAIRFVYDDEGRVSQCYYEIDGEPVFVSYAYKDGSVQIYAFMGELVVADEIITLPGEYDASIGFTSSNGYYFKGYPF